MARLPFSQGAQRSFVLSPWKTGLILAPAACLALALLWFPAMVIAEAVAEPDSFSIKADSVAALILMGAVGGYLVYSALLLGCALLVGRPLVEVDEGGVAALGFSGWKRFEWSEVEEAEIAGGAFGSPTIRVRGKDRWSWERLLRLATLGTAGNWGFVVCLFLREPAPEVVAAFNRNCPARLRL